MKRIIAFIILMVTSINSFSQKQNNIWYFGANAGLDFSSGSPQALTNSAMYQVEGTASMSDTLGNLLFYTDGITVWNKNHVQMSNGNGLLGNSSSTQSALIVPQPLHCGIYYLFTVPSEDDITPLSYSIIDMNANAGLGDVINKNIPLHHPVNEKLTGTLHGNGKDYWIVAQEHGTSAILSYQLSENGLNSVPVVTYIPALADVSKKAQSYLGAMKISKDGTKLCYTFIYYANISVLLDFNYDNGSVSNPIVLQNSSGGCGVEFSPDNSKLYISTINSPYIIWQYDLTVGSARSIQNSVVVIDSQYIVAGKVQYGGALELGPDGKIYANRLQHSFLSVINEPDLKGALSNYKDLAVSLNGRKCQEGLPNYIKQYCSCTGTFCSHVLCKVRTPPNLITPDKDGINDTFYIDCIQEFNWKLEIYNRWGQLVYRNDHYKNNWEAEGLSDGVYYYSISSAIYSDYKYKGWIQVMR
jgi:gliding motility-associated-like protein